MGVSWLPPCWGTEPPHHDKVDARRGGKTARIYGVAPRRREAVTNLHRAKRSTIGVAYFLMFFLKKKLAANICSLSVSRLVIGLSQPSARTKALAVLPGLAWH